ncbi:MAG TPA: hypothetical protein VFX15_09750, partial [Actinomycetes bacterium]|nr:hypothetical protein [Actinomycetes bacterium]
MGECTSAGVAHRTAALTDDARLTLGTSRTAGAAMARLGLGVHAGAVAQRFTIGAAALAVGAGQPTFAGYVAAAAVIDAVVEVRTLVAARRLRGIRAAAAAARAGLTAGAGFIAAAAMQRGHVEIDAALSALGHALGAAATTTRARFGVRTRRVATAAMGGIAGGVDAAAAAALGRRRARLGLCNTVAQRADLAGAARKLTAAAMFARRQADTSVAAQRRAHRAFAG